MLCSRQMTYSTPSRMLHLPKPPPEEKQDNEPQASKGSVLLQQQFPIDPHRSPFVLGRIFLQPRAEISHLLEAITAV